MHRPQTIDEAASIVRESRSVRGVGSRHSFTDIGDADDLIDLERPRPAGRVRRRRADGHRLGCRHVRRRRRALGAHGAALRNLASLPHISVAGAIATATHGSGATHGNLATSVAGLEFIAPSGEIVTVDRRTPDFDGMVVSLGALGLVTAVTLDVDFDYEISQHVYDDLPLDLAVEQLGHDPAARPTASASSPRSPGR